jgi:hypothetical protein
MKRRGEKHFRNATVMKAAEQIEAKLKDVVTNAALDEKNFLTLGALRPTQENIRALANRLTALETSHALVVDSGRGIEERFKISADNHSALESHHTTAHGVTVQRLNSIQNETAKLAGLIATLGEVMLRLENRIAQLENKSGVFYTNSPTPIAVFAGTPHQPTPDFTVTCAQKELVINPVGMG